MTPSDLSRMEALAERATKGPWCEYANTVAIDNNAGQDVRASCDPAKKVARDMTVDDMRFIAASRTFIPQAITEIRKQRAEIERLRALLKSNAAIEEAFKEGCGKTEYVQQHCWEASDGKRALEGTNG